MQVTLIMRVGLIDWFLYYLKVFFQTEYVASNCRLTERFKFLNMWTDLIVTYFKVRSQYFLGRNEENHESTAFRQWMEPGKSRIYVAGELFSTIIWIQWADWLKVTFIWEILASILGEDISNPDLRLFVGLLTRFRKVLMRESNILHNP